MSPPNPPAIRVHILTLAYQPQLGAIDGRPLDALVADKHLLDLREHFFTVLVQPHLCWVLTWRHPIAANRDSQRPPMFAPSRPKWGQCRLAQSGSGAVVVNWRLGRADVVKTRG